MEGGRMKLYPLGWFQAWELSALVLEATRYAYIHGDFHGRSHTVSESTHFLRNDTAHCIFEGNSILGISRHHLPERFRRFFLDDDLILFRHRRFSEASARNREDLFPELRNSHVSGVCQHCRLDRAPCYVLILALAVFSLASLSSMFGPGGVTMLNVLSLLLLGAAQLICVAAIETERGWLLLQLGGYPRLCSSSSWLPAWVDEVYQTYRDWQRYEAAAGAYAELENEGKLAADAALLPVEYSVAGLERTSHEFTFLPRHKRAYQDSWREVVWGKWVEM
ncbi:hypothetical protein B0H63DRAFT_445924 [Podospora didyma]|uniref:Uncharacterized protein n=1 Tax=Podospora didyma TaxID=330526 RepID=A0AAE0NXY9_9PEZI|nr:hypothetical protein B0H63DRAFT_445924 [Podospora didyma]